MAGWIAAVVVLYVTGIELIQYDRIWSRAIGTVAIVMGWELLRGPVWVSFKRSPAGPSG